MTVLIPSITFLWICIFLWKRQDKGAHGSPGGGKSSFFFRNNKKKQSRSVGKQFISSIMYMGVPAYKIITLLQEKSILTQKLTNLTSNINIVCDIHL